MVYHLHGMSMWSPHRPLDDDRARLALEQAQLLVHHLERDERPNFGFVLAHALTLLQLIDGIDEGGPAG